MISLKPGGALLLAALLSLSSQVHAAESPFDIDVKELDRQAAPAVSPKAEPKKAKKAKKAAPAAAAKSSKPHQEEGGDAYIHYAVKPGDHIFKILVVRFGMSNEAAERLIPEIVRINHISNIKRLTVGHTLLIPGAAMQERLAKSSRHKARHQEEEAAAASPAVSVVPAAPTALP